MKYRRRPKSDTWHFCRNCTQWPTKDYRARDEKPTMGEFCNQCLSKRKRKVCESDD